MNVPHTELPQRTQHSRCWCLSNVVFETVNAQAESRGHSQRACLTSVPCLAVSGQKPHRRPTPCSRQSARGAPVLAGRTQSRWPSTPLPPPAPSHWHPAWRRIEAQLGALIRFRLAAQIAVLLVEEKGLSPRLVANALCCLRQRRTRCWGRQPARSISNCAAARAVLAHSRNSSVQKVHVVFVLCLNINFNINSEGTTGTCSRSQASAEISGVGGAVSPMPPKIFSSHSSSASCQMSQKFCWILLRDNRMSCWRRRVANATEFYL